MRYQYYISHMRSVKAQMSLHGLASVFTNRANSESLSYDIASGSEITPCNKINKPVVVYRFSGNIMTL